MLDYVTELPLPGRVLAPLGALPRGGDARGQLPAFVAGPENRLVAGAIGELVEATTRDGERDAAQQIVPSVLVLFGASGTGKSHLAYGVVRHWQSQLGDTSALYTTAADFRHLLNDAAKRQAEVAFREEFRGRQLLAIDDLQHLPAGDFAWQELRYTLDDYDDRGATVIVTANESIAQLANVPFDIRGRLASGLALELSPPGGEARLRILRHAAAALQRPLSDDAAECLARGLNGPANCLFQALFELFAPATGRAVSDTIRAERLLAARAARRPTLREIIAVVARQQGVTQAQFKSASRQRSIVTARGIVVYLARELSNISYDEIGRALGGRDHTTIIHNYRKIDGLQKCDVRMQQTLEQLRRILSSR
jgi:chromosomal replication initiator protein